ncbi:hypothetical protein GC175_17515 [bacterium]|nr:hypothetical protein [bacterium]
MNLHHRKQSLFWAGWLLICLLAAWTVGIGRADGGFSQGAAYVLEAEAESPIVTPTVCPVATPEPLWVEPVLSPTFALTQTLVVYAGNSEAVTVTTVSGVFSVTGDFGGTVNPARVDIDLLPETTHQLNVASAVKHVENNGCSYGGYTHSTNRDRNGSPLIIRQEEAALFLPMLTAP